MRYLIFILLFVMVINKCVSQKSIEFADYIYDYQLNYYNIDSSKITTLGLQLYNSKKVNKKIFSTIQNDSLLQMDTIFIINGHNTVGQVQTGRIWNSNFDIRYNGVHSNCTDDTLYIFNNFQEYRDFHTHLVGMLPRDYLKEYYPFIEKWDIKKMSELQEKHKNRLSDNIYFVTLLIVKKNDIIEIKHVKIN